MCIDYWKLNKATKKDHFPLPFIDKMLEHLVNHSFFCFHDGYFGYHRISIHLDDQSKTVDGEKCDGSILAAETQQARKNCME